jgi:hypothetical protein
MRLFCSKYEFHDDLLDWNKIVNLCWTSLYGAQISFGFRLYELTKSLKMERGNQNPQTEEGQTTKWHRYSVAVDHFMVVKLSKWCLQPKPLVTLGSVASFLAENLYQGNHGRNHKLWKIRSTKKYNILHMMYMYIVRYTRHVWKYQRGNQKSQIKEG